MSKDSEEQKRTNEIKLAITLPDAIEIKGKDDALLIQRNLADYLVLDRQAPDFVETASIKY